ncbi:MAG TPA: plastocyanin/azurin family copper-binding protein [Ktedonobacterales bacterium]|nr:plastocyanin/azurin family copper-binding protein [Ktedonobacterales bacterium]
MRKSAFILFAIFVFALAACGGTTAGGGGGGGSSSTGTTGNSATIGMAATSFSGSTNVTIKAGQSVTFNDPSSSGGTHDLVTGTHGMFTAAQGAPSEFSPSGGVVFNPGDTKAITFPTAGTFKITCTIHPSMQVTITVTP